MTRRSKLSGSSHSRVESRRSERKVERLQAKSDRRLFQCQQTQLRRQTQRIRYLNAFKGTGIAFRTWWLQLIGLLTFVVRPIVGKAQSRQSVRRAKNADYTSHVPRMMASRSTELLEDRTLLTVDLSYSGTGNALTLSESAADTDTVTISETVANTTVRIDLGAGNTFGGGSTTTATGLAYQNSDSPGTSQWADVSISALASITTLTVNLGGNDDSLTIGTTDNEGITNISVDGGGGTDVVTLNAISVPGTLSVAAESISLNANVTTTNADMTLSGTVNITGNSTLAAGSGTVTLGAATLSNGVTLTLGTGGSGAITATSFIRGTAAGTASHVTFNVTGAVTVSGTIGTDIGTLTVTNFGGATFSGAVGASSDRIASVILTATTGTVAFSSNLNATGVTNAGGSFNLNLYGTTTSVTNAVTFGTSGTVAFGNGSDTLTFTGGLVHSAGATSIGGSIISSDQDISLAATTLTANSDIDTTGTAAGNILFSSTIATAGNALALDAGAAGNITLSGALTGGGAMTVRAGAVQNYAALTAGSLYVQNAATSVTFNGAIAATTTIDVNSAGSIVQTGAVASGTSLNYDAVTTIAINAGITVSSTVNIDSTGVTTIAAAGDINAGGAVSITGTGGISTAGDITTTNDNVTFVSAVSLAGPVAISTGSGIGTIAFNSTLNGGQTLSLTAGTGNVLFTGTVGGTVALASILVNSGTDVTLSSTVRTSGNLTQSAGTGTTTFNGTSGRGIGGNLAVTTNAITLSSSPIVTVGTGNLNAQNAIAVNASAGLNAGASTITILANQDGAGSAGFTQASGTTIQTTNTTATALGITVGGTGGAAIAALQTGVSGRLTITAGGAITDNNSASINITGGSAPLTAVGGIGSSDALETAISTLAAVNTSSGNIQIDNSVGGLLTIGTVNSLSGVINGVPSSPVNSGGSILITNGSPVTVSAPVINAVGGPITIAAEGSLATDDLTINANITATGGTGNISLFAGGDIQQTAGTISAVNSGAVNLSAGENYNDGTNAAGNANASVTQTSGLTISSGSGSISIEAPATWT